ncbi:cytochrome c oxidase accessory protein CcoG [Candidatus Ornithobacterium hominis]|uniref:cytochrome c oxidase accessory protein CcoG n=1 Tax=Candidatus Ornithobacterium hominis TaxID=2497989 RepID=UPI0024BC205D|nr:cytochrome c oxidase accessory protein CcoG [Candidatus Ornithobacterium hominis]CAI9428777.1 cytochrome c oxidase accessory protein CcoG [Candidatus Ornithobacterium hominis]
MSTNQNKTKLEDELESFRNSIGTAEKSGKRKWVFAKKPKGKYYNYRSYVSWFLILILLVVPFIKINGNPLFKFDVIKGEFYLFSYPFFTSDFKILAIGMITTMVFIILFTVVYGRIFCGWICPQTIFLEMVFRKIEYVIDGDRNKQIKLKNQAWNEEKIRKRLLKWTIYAIISFIISNILFAWVIGVDKLKDLIVEGPVEHFSTLLGLLIFTGIFYFIFTWFREQACVLVCPYGRLQGVLIDKKTIIVAYDYVRGEREKGRQRFKRGQDREDKGIGDCIDCGQCVAVCPTGIDIRNGTQLECVNCTACIDACDEVMTKINLPTGLIRYASEEEIAEKKPFKFTARMIGYSVVLLILIGVLASFLFMRSDVNSKFLRMPGTDYKTENHLIMNQFTYQLQNKTKETKQLHLKLASHPEGEIILENGTSVIIMQPGGEIQGNMVIKIPREQLRSYKERIEIELVDENNKLIDSHKTSFAAPFQ